MQFGKKDLWAEIYDDCVVLDGIFQEGATFRSTAIVGGLMTDMLSLSVYYEESARTLTEHVLERGEQDLHFLPICYLFRHSMELALKYLIQRTTALLGSKDSAFPFSHSLTELTDALNGNLAALDLEPLTEQVVSVLVQFDSFDPDGARARYPVRKTGRKIVRIEENHPVQRTYDVALVAKAAVWVLMMLTGGLASQLEQHSESAQEFQAWLHSNATD